MKLCPICKETKYVDQFYRRGKYLLSYCIECQKVVTRRNAKDRPAISLSPEVDWHRDAMNRLLSMGLPTISGRPMFSCDLVIYGCIRVNLKKPTTGKSDSIGKPYPIVHFSEKERREGLSCDIVAVWYGDEIFLFRSNTPAFYRNGKIKTGFLFDQWSQHRKRNGTLTLDAIRKAHNNITLIKSILIEYQTAMREGFLDTSTVNNYLAKKERKYREKS